MTASTHADWKRLIAEYDAFTPDSDFERFDADRFVRALVSPPPEFAKALIERKRAGGMGYPEAVRTLYAFLLEKRYDERLNLLHFAFSIFDETDLPEAVVQRTPFPHEDGFPEFRHFENPERELILGFRSYPGSPDPVERSGMVSTGIDELLKTSSMCVLATCADNIPHCSLMTYLPNEAGTTITLMTLKRTQKYRNMQQNPRVSMLIDSRATSGCERSDVKALTVAGTAVMPADEDERKQARRRMIEAHPHLRELAAEPDAEIVFVKVESFMMLRGVLDSHYIPIT